MLSSPAFFHNPRPSATQGTILERTAGGIAIRTVVGAPLWAEADVENDSAQAQAAVIKFRFICVSYEVAPFEGYVFSVFGDAKKYRELSELFVESKRVVWFLRNCPICEVRCKTLR